MIELVGCPRRIEIRYHSHSTIAQLLLELVASILYPLAGSLQVVHRDASMAEALLHILTIEALLIAVGVHSALFVLRSVVMRQLNQALALREVLAMGCSLGSIKAHKV